VAVAWAVGYPIAFAALAYLVTRTIDLDLRAYVRGTWGIIASCGIGTAVGFGVGALIPHASDLVRVLAIGGSALAVIAILLATWQKITPRSIAGSLA
jgi:hypothetical protein